MGRSRVSIPPGRAGTGRSEIRTRPSLPPSAAIFTPGKEGPRRDGGGWALVAMLGLGKGFAAVLGLRRPASGGGNQDGRGGRNGATDERGQRALPLLGCQGDWRGPEPALPCCPQGSPCVCTWDGAGLLRRGALLTWGRASVSRGPGVCISAGAAVPVRGRSIKWTLVGRTGQKESER